MPPKIPFFTGKKSKSTLRETGATATCSGSVEAVPQTVEHVEYDMEKKVRVYANMSNSASVMIVNGDKGVNFKAIRICILLERYANY